MRPDDTTGMDRKPTSKPSPQYAFKTNSGLVARLYNMTRLLDPTTPMWMRNGTNNSVNVLRRPPFGWEEPSVSPLISYVQLVIMSLRRLGLLARALKLVPETLFVFVFFVSIPFPRPKSYFRLLLLVWWSGSYVNKQTSLFDKEVHYIKSEKEV